jgi:hypothetical protein
VPFHLIRGTLHVVGYSPDGDSIRFKAANESNWDLLNGPPAKRNARGHAQLRLEAIDTLETHFQGLQQPPPLTTLAMDRLLAAVGITGVVLDASGKVIAANDGTPGYILSREVEKNRRPVCFMFAGNPPEPDGSPVFLDAARLADSVNVGMLASGLAYPTYYQGLFPDLRALCTLTTTAARSSNLGVWQFDKTTTGFEVNGLSSVTDDHVILPKLFRRLAAYLETGGDVSGFIDAMELLQEPVLVINTAHATHFDNLLEVVGNRVRMLEPPENLMFMG